MILDPAERMILWGAHARGGYALHVLDLSSGKISAYVLYAYPHMFRIHSGRRGYFTVETTEHVRVKRIGVRHHDAPGVVLGECVASDDQVVLSGPAEPWLHVRRYYDPPEYSYSVIAIGTDGGAQRMWLPKLYENYDISHEPIEIFDAGMGSEIAFITLRFGDGIIVYDLIANNIITELGTEYGGCVKRVSMNDVFYAANQREVIRFVRDGWRVSHRFVLSGLYPQSHLLSFNTDESLLLITVMGTGDILALDANTLKLKGRAMLGDEFYSAVMLRDGRVFALSHQSELMTGQLVAV